MFLIGCLCGVVTAAAPQAVSQLATSDSAAFTVSNDDVTRILEDRVDHMQQTISRISAGICSRVEYLSSRNATPSN